MPRQPTILASHSEAEALMKSLFHPSVNLLAFYNSSFDKIVKNPELIVMPIIDRQFYLAHSIFDSLTCNKCKIPLLERIIIRIKQSCEIAAIPLPMSLEEIKLKISNVASFCISEYDLKDKKFFIRLWISSGLSHFSLLPEEETKPIFYIVAYTSPRDFDLTKVYKETSISSIKIKEGAMVHSKTSNYLTNCLIAMEANKSGALNGVMLDKDGFITECPIANIGFVWKKNKVFMIPKWDKVLKGSTLTECITFIKKKLIPEGVISRIEQKDMKPSDIYGNADEMIVFGGGKVIAIGEFDGHFIRKDLGPICRSLQNYLREEYNKTAFKVNHTLYNKKIPLPKL